MVISLENSLTFAPLCLPSLVNHCIYNKYLPHIIADTSDNLHCCVHHCMYKNFLHQLSLYTPQTTLHIVFSIVICIYHWHHCI